MLQYNLRDYEEAYGQKRRQQHQLFRAKVRHQEELEFEDMEQLHRSNETRKFYKKLNGSRNGFTPRVEMCRDKNGAILTNERECREYQVPTHHLFIDFKAAYDSVDREELWKIMDENGFPGKLIRLIKMTMDGARCCVKISGAESDSFTSLGGLRQGDGISCLCFNVVLEGVMRRAGFNMRGTIFSKSNQFICFADDMDIVGRTFKAVADAYTDLKREAEKVVEEFVYLGSLVTSDNSCSREIRRRIIAGSRAYFGLHKSLRSRKFSLHTTCSIYKSLIRPVVLYGHETWTMLEEDLRALSVFERRVLRTIFGGVYENDGWRRRMNHELAQLYNEPSIRKVAKAGRLQWAGHVARMPERTEQLSQRNQKINPAKLVFVSEP
ncbi:uncharacterized protein LOC120431820, partial [Culex pipiens pallens]|uniref:uncharacterized protein LOC120431820 n=1 Tax=Culex pipiens pallens TaxID=42434 RepID=UPI001953C8B3